MGNFTENTTNKEKVKIDGKTDEILSQIYYNISNPSSLSGFTQLYEEVKKQGLSLPETIVKKWIKKQEVYTLHKQRKLKFQRLRYIPSNIDDVWSIDLADMQNISSFNYKNRYILAIIDNFSRYAWCVPIKNKTSESVIKAFEIVFKKTKRRPLNVLSDRGREFVNNKFINFLKKYSINFYTANDPATKASVCERFIRSIKSIIYKYFTYKKTKKYIDVLDKLVDIYNNRKHRSIGRSPVDVNENNILSVWKFMTKNYPKTIFNEKRVKFNVGTFVRISNPKQTFDKGYKKQWSDEIFLVHKVILSYPHTYKLTDLNGELIEGKFYEAELQEVVININ